MVNLIVSHGSQFQRNPAQNSTISIRSTPHQSSHARTMDSWRFAPPRPPNTTAPTKTISSEHHINLSMSSLCSNSPSTGGIDGYRTNDINFGYPNKHELANDYDSNVTKLYELLESSQWEPAIARCLNFPEEVRTWIVRRGDSKLRWKVLPLHAAIIFKAPRKVVQALLRIYPLASSKQDDQGMLPLHLAFRHKRDEEVLQKLLEVYPVGINQKDRRGRIPIDHAGVASFSGRFVHLYAHAASSHDGGLRVSEERDAGNDAKVASTEMLYELRMKDMESHFEEEISRLRMTVDECNRNARNPNERRSMHVETEVQLLRSSLDRANVESKKMMQVLKHSRDNEKHMENKFQALLKNQQALHRLCMKQQHQLEQAQRIKTQMLQSMLNSEEDRSALGMATEISQVSSNLVVSTRDILTHVASSKFEKEGDKRNPIAIVEPEGNILHGFQDNSNSWMRSIAEHGDEISGITEVSKF